MMNQHPRMPLNWHQVNEQALQRAGNCNIVSDVVSVYRRYPGLNVLMLDRLDFVDTQSHMMAAENGVYNIDAEKFQQAMMQKLTAGASTEALSAYEAHTITQYAVEELQRSRGVCHVPVDRELASFLRDRYSKDASKPVSGYIFGGCEMKTRHEDLARFAGLVRNDIHAPDDVTYAEMDRFTITHEYQHARNAQTFLLNFFGNNDNPAAKSVLDDVSLNYSKLREKFEGLLDEPQRRDKYSLYIDETLADTGAVLHHLKSGGSLSLVRAISEARACGYVENADWQPNPGRIYASHVVLDKVLENYDLLKDTIKNTPEEELDVLAIGLVGDFAWGRREYYKNAISANQAKVVDIKAKGLLGEDDLRRLDYIKTQTLGLLYEARAFKEGDTRSLGDVYGEAIENMGVNEASIKAAKERSLQGQQFLTSRGQVTPEDHLVEIKAAIKYSQIKHPEFECQRGVEQLLRIRKAYIAENVDQQGRMAHHPAEEQIVSLIQEEAARKYGAPSKEVQEHTLDR